MTLVILPLALAGQDVDISVALKADGSAEICETWDLELSEGTEFSLVRENLGDMVISDLSVQDETGLVFVNEGSWNVNRSLSEKAGRCGILRKSDGCEICWGLGSYGRHTYHVRYTMTNVIESLDDYDALHLQLVSPGIRPRIRNARVNIYADGRELNDVVSRIWGFGFEGTTGFEDGQIVVETEEPFTSNQNSVIVLARFDKGMFSPGSVQRISFQDKLDEAFEGSSYGQYLKDQKRNNILEVLFMAISLFFLVFVIWAIRRSIRNRNLKMFGVKKIKEIGYERDLPFDGNLFATRYIYTKCGRILPESAIASAIILRMVKNGQISLTEDARGKVLLSFAGKDLESLTKSERDLYEMIREAAGSDGILQDKEFSRWSRRHAERVTAWSKGLDGEGAQYIREKGYVQNKAYSPDGQMNARRAIGFRNYLNDFTLLSERKSAEVALWHDYIVFAALYGIADKVAKELKDIDPKAFEAAVGYDYVTMHRLVYLSDHMGASITNTIVRQQTASSVGGHGGFSSIGGGGGFHGGGFGGGVR